MAWRWPCGGTRVGLRVGVASGTRASRRCWAAQASPPTGAGDEIGRARLRMMSSKRLFSAPWVQTAIGVTAAEYLRLVRITTRFAPDEPADIYDSIARDAPVILAMWHGQHFLTPFLRRPEHRAKVLVSAHRAGA